MKSGRDHDINSNYLETYLREAYDKDVYRGVELPSAGNIFVPTFEGVATVMFPKFWWG